MFDNAPRGKKALPDEPEAARRDAEDARIALRCNRKELQLVDSFVTAGEYVSRSELMRVALHAFLRSRALSTAPAPPVDAEGYVEVPVRLTPEEYGWFEDYARHIGNRRPVKDLLAEVVRHGAHALKVRELAEVGRAQAREAAERRTQVGALRDHAEEMERDGRIGR